MFFFKHINSKLSGGIMTYVLTIGILVSTVLSMLILYLYYSRLAYKTYDRRITLVDNLEVAIDITKGDYGRFEYGETYNFDLYGSGSDSISINRQKWGLFDRFIVRSFFGKISFAKAYIIAHKANSQGRSSIYLQDDGRSLAVAGSTTITGKAYLPKAGIQSAYVGRIGYQNKELMNGKELRSEKEFPEISLQEVINGLKQHRGNLIDELTDTTQSFFNEPSIFEGFELTVFDSISGNIVLKSDRKLVFSAESSITDVIAYAPVIIIEEDFKGRGQFFAEDTLIVEENVVLNYPTVLAVYNKNKPALIKLHEKSKTNGWILMDGQSDGLRRRVVYMEDGSQHNGMVYCNGMTEIYGKIIGNVTTRRFLINAPSAVYENYLFNATIDATMLHPNFLALGEWFYSDTTEVLKYLY